ncbi:unnamed protein product [Rhodiola kirilowii]
MGRGGYRDANSTQRRHIGSHCFIRRAATLGTGELRK